MSRENVVLLVCACAVLTGLPGEARAVERKRVVTRSWLAQAEGQTKAIGTTGMVIRAKNVSVKHGYADFNIKDRTGKTVCHLSRVYRDGVLKFGHKKKSYSLKLLRTELNSKRYRAEIEVFVRPKPSPIVIPRTWFDQNETPLQLRGTKLKVSLPNSGLQYGVFTVTPPGVRPILKDSEIRKDRYEDFRHGDTRYRLTVTGLERQSSGVFRAEFTIVRLEK